MKIIEVVVAIVKDSQPSILVLFEENIKEL